MRRLKIEYAYVSYAILKSPIQTYAKRIVQKIALYEDGEPGTDDTGSLPETEQHRNGSNFAQQWPGIILARIVRVKN